MKYNPDQLYNARLRGSGRIAHEGKFRFERMMWQSGKEVGVAGVDTNKAERQFLFDVFYIQECSNG